MAPGDPSPAWAPDADLDAQQNWPGTAPSPYARSGAHVPPPSPHNGYEGQPHWRRTSGPRHEPDGGYDGQQDWRRAGGPHHEPDGGYDRQQDWHGTGVPPHGPDGGYDGQPDWHGVGPSPQARSGAGDPRHGPEDGGYDNHRDWHGTGVPPHSPEGGYEGQRGWYGAGGGPYGRAGVGVPPEAMGGGFGGQGGWAVAGEGRPGHGPGAGRAAFAGYQAAQTAPWQPVGTGGGPPAPTLAGVPEDLGQSGRGTRRPSPRRRRLVVAALVATAGTLGVYAIGQAGGAMAGGRALGILTGDAGTLSPGLVAPAGPGAPGEGPLDPSDPDAPASGPEATVVAPGSDGVVGTDDDVVVAAGGTRGGPTPSGGSATTEPTGSTTSTSTTLPPIPTDLAITGVEVPSTAPGSTDGCGKDVAFDGARVADDQAETAWRMEGDGTGQSLTLSLGGSHRIVSVGMIPGYALTDPCDGTDRFVQNRRITRVTWQFDDGSAPVVQDLRDAAEMQRVAVSAQATTVTVRIDGVTADPERDFTAISEIDVRGT